MIKQTENEVEADVVGWLRKRGWIVRRQHVGTFYTSSGIPISIGETGACDWWGVRAVSHGYAEYIEIEIKATGKRPSKKQGEYMALRKHRGFTCIWADSLEIFEKKYMTYIKNHADS